MKKKPPKKAARAARSKPAPPRPEPPPPGAATTTAQPTLAPSRRVVGRLHRATLTPAGLRGRDLVRFLRIHSKHPYGTRGEEAIHRLAVEVGHLGNLELNARPNA
jgi:hypothetical protein